MTYTFLYSLQQVSTSLITFFSTIWDYLFQDLWTLLTENSNGFIERILESLGFVGLDIILSSITLGGFLFSVGVVALIILKFLL